jgi:hypothetical protein
MTINVIGIPKSRYVQLELSYRIDLGEKATHREFPIVHVMRVDAFMLFVLGGDSTVQRHLFLKDESECCMVGGAECAVYLHMILYHLTKLSHAAHLNLPLVVTKGEMHF